MEPSYQITGGYNDNAVKISQKTERQECAPQWIYLKTLTGDYLKYVMKEEYPPMVSALAGTDALCYCNENPCLGRVFRCRRGLAAYTHSEGMGLLEMSLDRMTVHQQTREKETGKQGDFLLHLSMNQQNVYGDVY